MQTTRLILSLASLAVLLLLAGTAGATPVPPATADGGERSVTVIDDSGKTVLIRGEPQRIVSLAPSNTEILYALGLEDRIVAVTERCDYPPATAEKPKVGGFSTVNIEKVIAMEPDLIFAAPANTDEVIDRLRSLGMTVVILDPQTIDGVLHDIELAGRATGQEEQASTLIEGLRVRIGAVAEKAAGGPAEEPSVAHVIWHDPLWVSGRGTFQDEVITLAGGANAFGSVDDWSIVSLEEFIITNPDYILVSSGSGMNRDGYDAIYNYIINEPRLQRLDAVRNDRVYVIDADVVSRGSPRIVDALEEVADYLHPGTSGAGTPEAAGTVQSPGFGAITLICALSAAVLLLQKR
ncbi:ABC transporter substrate-binding protein [Methanoculleus chikugoensis]|uniref:ABC transporter substrate-binding protein n=1 Tax=Methanoculleus chikugoensis TaxID=118126 RepID=A0ABN5XF93_9EURY|nr:cobalamin-binding protein [Methanoculleus chikugoensis]BBL67545.1 ABC transporter substrate-binding protein [Methanoculleus chikugoensis]